MFRPRFLAAALLPLIISCAADRGGDQNVSQTASARTSEPSRETFALGTAVNPEGSVPRDATSDTFSRGGEVFLSINVAGATTDQDVQVDWVNADGEVMRRDQVEVPVGSRYAAFSSGDTRGWTPGPHRAVVTINGRRVSEQQFQVTDLTARADDTTPRP